MPESRRDWPTELPAQITYESGSRDPAAVRRRYRRGTTARTSPGKAGALPVEVRNGLPFRPYVYRGTGFDQLTASMGDADADQ